MASEQGAGHGVESNRRHMSTSAADSEPIQETETQTTEMTPAPPTQPESQYQQPKQGLPRHINKSPNPQDTPTPTSTISSMSMSGVTPSSSIASATNTPTIREERDYFGSARQRQRVEPPVTKATLSELDVQNIVHNPRLRHDINFDPELHFRPNIDGSKGRRKGLKAERFWTALHEQLLLFVMNRDSFYELYGTDDDWCLPQLLFTVKDIIQTLVPARDRAYLEEGLNVPLLMQQFNKGIADLEKLAQWLSGVLKSHCAPMRDDWVDRMYARLSNGNRNNDMNELVQGMRNLLEVLEAMKLDVANHQIRCLRPVLIEDTVHFEQRFVTRKAVPQRKVDLDSSRRWYVDADERYARTVSPTAAFSFGDMAVFFEALSRLILPSTADSAAPSTLVLHDQDRLAKLRSDALDAINLEVCMRLYEDLERVSRAVNSFYSNGFPTQSMEVEEESTISRTSSPFAFDFNTRPSSGSRPASLAISSADSATSSPRSSMVLQSHVTSNPDHAEAKTQSRNVYNSLVALVQTAAPVGRSESRWAAMAPSLALQIFRYTNAPQDMLPNFEAKLLEHVKNVQDPLFREVEEQFHNRLFAELQRRVRELKGLTGVDLFSVATGGRLNGQPKATRDSESDAQSRDENGIKDMALRLAHMGILHWKVFADIAYVGDGSVLSRDMPAPGDVHP
ncbi:SOK1 protein [Plectosphaerella plurivora]|uniref:SOK1 protein n=1 Tax=Plectosphaerella plurivora TaxID=936078 RepID=A0A9P9A6M1_9PEZI|nr:SOK1 protein [Plectosphaerella plurivora]